MKAKLVCYSLEKETPATRTKLHRELYGYKDISNRGKYSYKRKGLIHRIRCEKVMNSVMLTNQKDSSEIIKLLRKYRTKIRIFTVLVKNTL